MSTPAPPVEEKEFNQAEFIKARNEGLPKPVDRVEPIEKAAPTEKKAEELQPVKVPRHIRRENNRLREEAAELRGKLAAYEKLGIKPNGEPEQPKGETDPRPKQGDFASEGEYLESLAGWIARQETAKQLSKRDEQTKEEKEAIELQNHVREMDAKFAKDKELIPDFAEAAKAALENDDLSYNAEEHPLLLGLIAHSDVRAFMLHHFAKEPADFQKMLKLKDDANGLIAAFKRLEGKVESVYSKQEPKEKAPEAPPKAKAEAKERTGPENTEQARAPKALPRPSTEVAARGGTAPPETPVPGTKAWFDWRNAQTGGR